MPERKPLKPRAALNAFILTVVVILAWTGFGGEPLGFLIPFTLVAAGIAGFGLWSAARHRRSSPNDGGGPGK